MTVDAAMSAAFDRVASRERDAMRGYTPGAAAENADVAFMQPAQFSLDSLSVALPEYSYAVVADGKGAPVYTRDGSFSMRDGTLIDQGGRPVQGFTRSGGGLSDLTIDSVDLALGRCKEIRIEADGRLTYAKSSIDPRTSERTTDRVTVGRIALARFPAATAMHALDTIHVAPAGTAAPHVGVAGDGNFAPLRPNRRTASGVDIDASLIKLKEAYLALDALRAARHAQGGVEKTTMDIVK